MKSFKNTHTNSAAKWRIFRSCLKGLLHYSDVTDLSNPLNTWRNTNVVITSKRRHFDVITSKWRRFDVITTLLLRNVFAGNYRQIDCLLQKNYTNNKENIKAPHCWPFCKGNHRRPMDSLHKGSVMWNGFPCHDVTMDSRWRTSRCPHPRLPVKRPRSPERTVRSRGPPTEVRGPVTRECNLCR